MEFCKGLKAVLHNFNVYSKLQIEPIAIIV